MAITKAEACERTARIYKLTSTYESGLSRACYDYTKVWKHNS